MGMCLDITGYGIKTNGELVGQNDLRDRLSPWGKTITDIIVLRSGRFCIGYSGSYTGGVNLQSLFDEWPEEDGTVFLLNIGDFESAPYDVVSDVVMSEKQLETLSRLEAVRAIECECGKYRLVGDGFTADIDARGIDPQKG